MSEERTVTVTSDDIAFVAKAKEHYDIFAEVADRQGEPRTAGILRKQAFYAERFLIRLATPTDSPTKEPR
jgi:rubrerythrin